MRRQSIILLAGAIGLLVVGCGGTAEESQDATITPATDASPSAVEQQPFDQPLVAQQDAAAKAKGAGQKGDTVMGLLEPTDPEERAKQVQASIRSRAGLDPFASLPPILTFSTPIASASARGNMRGGSGGNGGSGSGSGSTALPTSVPALPAFPQPPTLPQPPKISVSQPGGGAGAPSQGLNPLPAIPEPTLAEAVEITGVVMIGATTKAIVKAPNEPTGRHVGVGQRLANGQVLVKRIEANAGSDPIVVLEQNGVEVSRRVGDKPVGKVDGQTA